MNYSYNDLVTAYRKLGVKPGDTVSLKTGLHSLGTMTDKKSESLDLHVKALDEVIDFDKGTVVVASTSTYLCNTETPFSMESTPGTMGILTEEIRNHKDSVRTYHAFESYCALGRDADQFCDNLSKHSYGVNTPEERLIDMNAICVSVGLPSSVTCSIIHHLEMMAGVPYRYVREYSHPVSQTDGSVENDIFFRHPWYINSDVRKDYKGFFKRLSSKGFETDRISVGKGYIEGYRLNNFYKSGMNILNSNIYAVLSHEPRTKPWEE